jgi:predicted metal-dependent hydrolase
MKTKAKKHVIKLGKRQIQYRLHLSERRSLKIIVSPELSVDVLAPKSAEDNQIHAAVQKKALWVARKLDRQETYHPLPTPKRYVSGETCVYLGRQYRLKVSEGNKKPAKLLGRFLWVRVADKTHNGSVRRAVNKWYRAHAHETFSRYMEKCYTIASRHGIPQPLLSIRVMRRRWGSCSSTGRITLNINLIQAPVHCIEYLIMHELCHLKYHNHSKTFFSFLTRCQPDWRKRKETLDKFRLT